MGLKSLKNLLALCLIVGSGQSLATISDANLPINRDRSWNDVYDSFSWSTDGGVTFGKAALTVGQTAIFKFALHKTLAGNHYADFMKVWLDRNNDGDILDSDEAILFGMHKVNDSSSNTKGDVPDGGVYSFTSNAVAINSGMLGTNYLLARVTCSESLLSTSSVGVEKGWYKQWSYSGEQYNSWFSPTTEYYQGESQYFGFTVAGNKVPEPGSVALLAAGFVGLGFARKRVLKV